VIFMAGDVGVEIAPTEPAVRPETEGGSSTWGRWAERQGMVAASEAPESSAIGADARAKDAGDEAFDRFAARGRSVLVAFAWSLTGSFAEAEELAGRAASQTRPEGHQITQSTAPRAVAGSSPEHGVAVAERIARRGTAVDGHALVVDSGFGRNAGPAHKIAGVGRRSRVVGSVDG
jgi:hypothetical protein